MSEHLFRYEVGAPGNEPSTADRCVVVAARGRHHLRACVRNERRELEWIELAVSTATPPRPGAFALARVAPGAWRVSPEVHLPGVWCKRLLIVDVPEPPPWALDPIADAQPPSSRAEHP